jgi:MFS family permease
VTGLATIGGPVIGGAVAEGISWEWIFWVNVPIGLVALPLALARIDESFGPDSALDLRGFALVTGGAFGIVWGLVRGNSAGNSRPSSSLRAACTVSIYLRLPRHAQGAFRRFGDPDRRPLRITQVQVHCRARTGGPS